MSVFTPAVVRRNPDGTHSLSTIPSTSSSNDDPTITDQAAFYVIADQASSSTLFIGESKNQSTPDTANGEWRIRRVTKRGNEEITEWANEAAFDQVWDDRDTLFPTQVFGNVTSIESDGINDRVFRGFNSELQFSRLTAFSMHAWVKFVGTPNNTNTIISHQDNGATTDGYGMRITNSGEAIFIFGSGAGNRIQVTSNTADIINASWHQIVMTYDGSGLASGVTIYIDNVDETGTVNNDNLTNEPTYVGPFQALSRGNNANDCLLGRADEIAMYNKELSSTEVAEIYGTGKATDLNTLTTASNLILWWRFDDDFFPTIRDRSDVGNGFDGEMLDMIESQLVGDAP